MSYFTLLYFTFSVLFIKVNVDGINIWYIIDAICSIYA